MLRPLMALALSVLVAAATSTDHRGWTYQSDFGGAASPQFVSSDDTILVYELNLTPYREQIRFLNAEGEVLAETTLTHRGQRTPHEFVLVDRWHVAMPMGDPSRVGLIPQENSPSPIAEAFLSWTETSGGIVQSIASLEASTNPYANLSCGIGNDGSVAVWRTTGDARFLSSAPNTVSLAHNYVVKVLCLEAQGRLYAAVSVVDRDLEPPQNTWLRIYEAGASDASAEFPLQFEGIGYRFNGRAAGTDLLVGMISARALDQEDWTWIATRVSFVDGRWQIENARLVGAWPQTFRVMRARDILISADESGLEMQSVPWAPGETTIPYVPRPFSARPQGFPGPHAISPSGRRLLWTNRDDKLRITSAPP